MGSFSPSGNIPFPVCPTRRIPAPEPARMRLLSPGDRPITLGGFVERESPVRTQNIAKDRFTPTQKAAPCHAAAASLAALSIEFVAKPAEARRAHMAIPETVNNTLKGVSGYAGCLVMASDQEARLITVITFWIGEDRGKRCHENQRWLCRLLAPFVEGCLRTRTFAAHRAEMLEIRSGSDAVDVHALIPPHIAEPDARFAA
jgi:hypothetical protein